MMATRSALSGHVGRRLAFGVTPSTRAWAPRGFGQWCCIRDGRVAVGGGGVGGGSRLGRRRDIRWQSSKGTLSEQSQTAQHTTSPPPPPPPNPNLTPQQAKRPLYIRLPIALALTLLTLTSGFIMTGAPAIPSLTELANPPTDAETLEMFAPPDTESATIERRIFSHPLTQSLLQDEKYTASRPHLKIPPQLRAQNLTAGTLLGEDKIAVPPLQFSTPDGSSFVSLQYVGAALCGHPGIVHGGLLATLLDEGLARCCFPALPNKVGVTASLKIDYKAPCLAGQIVVLRAETTKVEGRKAWVKGRLETLGEEGKEGVVVTEAEALFIEPRQAAQLKRVVN